MKRFSALFAMLALVLGSLVFIGASPASARKVDRRPCVSKAEFQAVHRPLTQAQVTAIFDVPGALLTRYDDYVYDGYWTSDYVEDGYWDSYDWNDDGIIDASETEWIDLSYWVDNWVDTSYWLTDTYRTYTKCHDRNFDRGRGRVAINFDNYTSPYSGLRVFSKFRNNPWHVGARIASADKSHPQNKTPQNTPAPHRNLKRTVIKTG